MKPQIFNKTDEEVNELLRHIEHVQLKAFIAEYAYLHVSFKKDIIKYFSPQHQEKSIAKYRAIVSGYFLKCKARRAMMEELRGVWYMNSGKKFLI